MGSVVVIGAGLSGLAAACHLRGAGHEVTVVERSNAVGGLAGRHVQDGFTFDTGPTVLTMPELVDDTLRAVGSSLAQRLRLTPLDPVYRGHFTDGTTIDVHADLAAMTAEVTRACGEREAARYRDHADWLESLFTLEFSRLIDVDYSSPWDLLRSPAALARLAAMGGFDRLARVVGRRFDDPRLQRLLTFQALYVGVSPQQALALYAVVTYLDSVAGVHHPAGGIHEVPRAMAAAFTAAGGTIRLDTAVTGLLGVAAGRVNGVRIGDGPSVERLRADAVVCSADLPTVWRSWLAGRRMPRAVRAGRHAPSALVWHVGVNGRPGPTVRHHNVHFGDQWDESFDDLLDSGRPMRDPSRLVTVPSISDPSIAPDGCSTLYVLEPVPNLAGDIDWSSEQDALRDRLQRFLGDAGYSASSRPPCHRTRQRSCSTSCAAGSRSCRTTPTTRTSSTTPTPHSPAAPTARSVVDGHGAACNASRSHPAGSAVPVRLTPWTTRDPALCCSRPATRPASARARCRGSCDAAAASSSLDNPMLARPSVSTTTSTAAGSHDRASSSAINSPEANGVPPPWGSRRNDARTRAKDLVGASPSWARRPRTSTTATRSRRR